ncbi:SNF2-related protein [Alkalibacillus haloalkaliphilus]|uniref:SNF2-related protein n=1 Tax=Alkalibacillus haloalkaliphilus TaxID=94136 RepID=UPI0002E911B6|nr:SNF2-related protein [Alkalibacillus haloalkaliphilus]
MFKSLNLKADYYSSEENLLYDFYEPVLTRTVRYDRVSGYFSGKLFRNITKSLSEEVLSSIKIRLIISEEISPSDYEAIKLGYQKRQKLIENLSKEIEMIAKNDKVTLNNIAYLIANGNLDIKFGFKEQGKFHSKFSLFYDEAENIIHTKGSNNETIAGYENNYEAFDVTISWIENDFYREKIPRAQKEFELLWNDKKKESYIHVKEIDEVITERLLEFNGGTYYLTKIPENTVILTKNNSQLQLINHLKDRSIFDPKKRFIKTKIGKYLSGPFPEFKNNLDYRQLISIIEEFEKHSKKFNYNLVVSQELESFIEQQNLMINERSDYGIYLKKETDSLKDKFRDFKQVVNSELVRELRPQQMHSAFYMSEMKRVANFSVPGSGKTSMVYGAFAYLSSTEVRNPIKRILMVGPKNSFDSWKLEFTENFGCKRQLDHLDIHELENAELELYSKWEKKNLILINYESLLKYYHILLDKLDSSTMLVFDEVHRIKNYESERAYAAKKISLKTNFRFVLTGTPIPNSYTDVYNFLNILFGEDYDYFFNYDVHDLKKPNQTQIEEINNKLYPFYWRTNKKELGVPNANPDIIKSVQPTEDEQAIIDLLYEKFGHSPFSLYIRLIQLSSNPKLLLKGNFSELIEAEEESNINFNHILSYEEFGDYSWTKKEEELINNLGVSSKYKLMLDDLLSLANSGKRVIVWCIFVDTINMVQNDLISVGINAEKIFGSTTHADRQVIIDRFKSGDIDVLITNHTH